MNRGIANGEDIAKLRHFCDDDERALCCLQRKKGGGKQAGIGQLLVHDRGEYFASVHVQRAFRRSAECRGAGALIIKREMSAGRVEADVGRVVRASAGEDQRDDRLPAVRTRLVRRISRPRTDAVAAASLSPLGVVIDGAIPVVGGGVERSPRTGSRLSAGAGCLRDG